MLHGMIFKDDFKHDKVLCAKNCCNNVDSVALKLFIENHPV